MTVAHQYETDAKHELLHARAMAELAERKQIRAVVEECRRGSSQRDIGKALNVSQATIHRILRRAQELPEALPSESSPREIILQAMVFSMPRAEMVAQILGPGVRSGMGDLREVDGDSLIDSWDEIEQSYADGLISERELEEISQEAGIVQIGRYPGLQFLAWHLKPETKIAELDALHIYERGWRQLDQDVLTDEERLFIRRLADTHGRGVLLV